MDERGPLVLHDPYYSKADAERGQHTSLVGWPDIIVGRIYKGKAAPFQLDQSKVTIGWPPRTSFYIFVNQLIICSARSQSFWTDCRSIQPALSALGRARTDVWMLPRRMAEPVRLVM
jgi:hypothetical protein